MPILLLSLFTILSPFCQADQITDYRVSITKENGYLIVITTKIWNGDTSSAWKQVWSPASYQDYSLRNGKWWPEKGGSSTFYEAYPRPNKKGFLLLKVVNEYESTSIGEISLFDIDDARHSLSPPRMSSSALYWSKDGSKLVIANPLQESKDPIFVFDALTCKKLEELPKDKLDLKLLAKIAVH